MKGIVDKVGEKCYNLMHVFITLFMNKLVAVLVLLVLFMFSTLRLDVLVVCSGVALAIQIGWELLYEKNHYN